MKKPQQTTLSKTMLKRQARESKKKFFEKVNANRYYEFGDVVWIYLGFRRDDGICDIGKIRPAVVLSVEMEFLTIAPITRSLHKFSPYRNVKLNLEGKESMAQMDDIRIVNKAECHSKLCRITNQEIQQINQVRCS